MEPGATSDGAGRTPVVVRDGLSVLPLSTLVTEHRAVARPEHTVLVNTGAPYRLVETLDGTTRRTRGLPGDVAVVPAGAELAVRSADGGPQEVESLVVSLTGDLLGEVLDAAGADPDRHELLPAVGTRSPRVAQLAGLVRSGLADRSDLGRLSIESLSHALVVAVARAHSTAAGAPGRPGRPGGLSEAQVARVLRHVEDHLDAPLTVSELAAVAHLSPFHFARQFRAATGASPHEYVVQRRLASAQELLARSRIPLQEVASRCGFADQSHLTRQVRRYLGTTPAAVRAGSLAR